MASEQGIASIYIRNRRIDVRLIGFGMVSHVYFVCARRIRREIGWAWNDFSRLLCVGRAH